MARTVVVAMDSHLKHNSLKRQLIVAVQLLHMVFQDMTTHDEHQAEWSTELQTCPDCDSSQLQYTEIGGINPVAQGFATADIECMNCGFEAVEHWELEKTTRKTR